MPELNVVALVKGADRFVFVYDDQSRTEVVAGIRDAAADPGLSLNWFDAAVLEDRVAEQTAHAAADAGCGGDG